MKTFHFKDLMINVVPAGKKVEYACSDDVPGVTEKAVVAGAAKYACLEGGVTEQYACGVTELIPKCRVTLFPTPRIQLDLEGVKKQLAAIKAQLQRELAAVEQTEKAVAEALRPHTMAELEELQGKLREAIAELDKRKQGLQKRKKPRKK